MLAGLMNFGRACWQPSSSKYGLSAADAVGRQDGLLWYKDLGHHLNGEFSMAVVQANSLLEDQSQLESGPLSSHESGPQGTFIGVYDGHGGPETALYVNDHIFHHLKSTRPFTVTCFLQLLTGPSFSRVFNRATVHVRRCDT